MCVESLISPLLWYISGYNPVMCLFGVVAKYRFAYGRHALLCYLYYCIVLTFRGSKFSQIAALKEFVEKK